MKLCILGNGLTSLCLAKSLVNKGISIEIFSKKNKIDQDKTRTIGLSKINLDYFNKEILNINKFLWKIRSIEIYSDNLKNEKILNFGKKNQTLFATFRNYEIYKRLFLSLKNNELCKFKDYKKLNTKDHNLIINCDDKNDLSKKFFFKKLKKKYNSFAHTTVIKHKSINNSVAYQVFTKRGPLAFLPLSETETSIVYSIRGNKKIDIKKLINTYNIKYSILSFGKASSFELSSSNLRSYYFKNILAFGDMLHRLHPLAGQGFNMTLRDIKNLNDIIQLKLDHGLELNSSVCMEFEDKTKHKNYLFSNGVDFIYELFNFESKINNNFLSKSIQFFGKRKIINNSFEKFANNGLEI